MRFQDIGLCHQFFNLMMIENNNSEHVQFCDMRTYHVTFEGVIPNMGAAGRVVVGLGGDIFIFKGDRELNGAINFELIIDVAVEDQAGPEPLTAMAQQLLTSAVNKDYTPTELLACLHQHRNSIIEPADQLSFDEAYAEELQHLDMMLSLMV
ncbi:hypothetical protein D3C87_1484000 [compost metagenome]